LLKVLVCIRLWRIAHWRARFVSSTSIIL
jgi:hypothetical protein